MTKQQTSLIKDVTKSPWWHAIRAGVSLICLVALLAIAGWFGRRTVEAAQTTFAGGMIVFLLQAIWVIVAERCLALGNFRLDWRLRLAFILPSMLFLIGGMILPNNLPLAIPVGWYLIAILGGFTGAMLATGLNMPLWENNFPPSTQVVEEVHQRHNTVIGKPAPTPIAKRIFDVIIASLGIIFSTPLWLLMSLLLWLEDPGPLFFVKNSVGKGGLNFHQYKFRTMVRSAELDTGPILASEGDERVLISGRLLRKTALDELPQLLNILKGEMSFVGPRPQRTVLVHDYLERIPSYAERHRVLPGLAGLAQVAGDYYLTPRQKLRFDRLYIQHTSLGFDIKLLCLAFLIAFWYRWQPGWNGRLPRPLLHSRK